MIDLRLLQNRLLVEDGLARPIQIMGGVKGDYLSISVVHLKMDGLLTMLTSPPPIKVYSTGVVELNGTWTVIQSVSIHTALKDVNGHVGDMEAEEEQRQHEIKLKMEEEQSRLQELALEFDEKEVTQEILNRLFEPISHILDHFRCVSGEGSAISPLRPEDLQVLEEFVKGVEDALG